MVLGNTTSCCELSNCTALCVCVWLLTWRHNVQHSSGTSSRPKSNSTWLRCLHSRFTHSEEWETGYSIKVTLNIYSFLLNLLFIQHLVSRETDERPFTLSWALHTTRLTHTPTHIWRWWSVMHDCEDVKGQTVILTVVIPPALPTSFCPHVYAPLLTLCVVYTLQATCCGGKSRTWSQVVRNVLCLTPLCSTRWPASPPPLSTNYRWQHWRPQDAEWSHPPPSPPASHQVQ